MRRVFLFALGFGLLVLAVAFLWIGAFPPKITPHEVTHVIPNDSFAHPQSAPAAPPHT